MTLLLSVAPALTLAWIALSYRRKWVVAQRKAQHWFDEYNRVEANHHRLVIRNLFDSDSIDERARWRRSEHGERKAVQS